MALRGHPGRRGPGQLERDIAGPSEPTLDEHPQSKRGAVEWPGPPVSSAVHRFTGENAPGRLKAALSELRSGFQEIASVMERLSTLQGVGSEQALIEMAMLAQGGEGTLEAAWLALSECEQLARYFAERDAERGDTLRPGDAAPRGGGKRRDASDEDESLITEVDATARACVLVVDDEPAVLRAFRRVLSQHHDVLTARDGSEALRVVLDCDPINAIICDLDMPKLDGCAFFAELGELRPQLLQRVVFCTGALSPNVGRLVEGLQTPLLRKPVTAPALLTAVENVRHG